MATNKFTLRSARCGSSDVTRDAIARWCDEQQAWEISCELDNTNCNECGHEDCLEEVSLEDAPFWDAAREGGWEPGDSDYDAHAFCLWAGLQVEAA